MKQSQKLGAAMAFFSAAGLVSSFWQLLDKIDLLKHPGTSLSCNLNSVFSCSKVLTSHQYEVFGFPNAMIGIVMFTFFLTMAIVLWTGSSLHKRLALTAQGMALFMLGFIIWFLFESTYRIGAVCLFCTIIGPSVLVLNILWLRLNKPLMPDWVQRGVVKGADIFIAGLLLVVAVFAVWLKLG